MYTAQLVKSETLDSVAEVAVALGGVSLRGKCAPGVSAPVPASHPPAMRVAEGFRLSALSLPATSALVGRGAEPVRAAPLRDPRDRRFPSPGLPAVVSLSNLSTSNRVRDEARLTTAPPHLLLPLHPLRH